MKSSRALQSWSTALIFTVTGGRLTGETRTFPRRVEQKVGYDRAHPDVAYNVGDTVLKRKNALSDASAEYADVLAPRWVGLFIVVEKIAWLNYKLKDSRSGRTRGPIHVGELEQYFRREKTADTPTSDSRGRELGEGGVEGRF
ncbi:hypothetical protein HPB48_026256 [Haemaphysalis longicornis]|uniref:Uncharacterized protein n=1 Tax=Haemaphysalis longicornis TaxID=44386 RepID=A0A9J6H0Q0_HAELO|nr:hypothetical protein HPB48_026256 [Haemaphysalis longicornis]